MSEGGCQPPGAAVNKKWMEREGGGALSCCLSSLTLTSLAAALLLPLGKQFIQSWIPLLLDAARFYVIQHHSCWSFNQTVETQKLKIDLWNNCIILSESIDLVSQSKRVRTVSNIGKTQICRLLVIKKCCLFLEHHRKQEKTLYHHYLVGYSYPYSCTDYKFEYCWYILMTFCLHDLLVLSCVLAL